MPNDILSRNKDRQLPQVLNAGTALLVNRKNKFRLCYSVVYA